MGVSAFRCRAAAPRTLDRPGDTASGAGDPGQRPSLEGALGHAVPAPATMAVRLPAAAGLPELDVLLPADTREAAAFLARFDGEAHLGLDLEWRPTYAPDV